MPLTVAPGYTLTKSSSTESWPIVELTWSWVCRPSVMLVVTRAPAVEDAALADPAVATDGRHRVDQHERTTTRVRRASRRDGGARRPPRSRSRSRRPGRPSIRRRAARRHRGTGARALEQGHRRVRIVDVADEPEAGPCGVHRIDDVEHFTTETAGADDHERAPHEAAAWIADAGRGHAAQATRPPTLGSVTRSAWLDSPLKRGDRRARRRRWRSIVPSRSWPSPRSRCASGSARRCCSASSAPGAAGRPIEIIKFRSMTDDRVARRDLLDDDAAPPARSDACSDRAASTSSRSCSVCSAAT